MQFLSSRSELRASKLHTGRDEGLEDCDMKLPVILRPALLLVLAATVFGQTRQLQVQSSPAPGFLAYQALFINVV
jgi:hypothetical protein